MAVPAALAIPALLKYLGYGTVGVSALQELAGGNAPINTAKSLGEIPLRAVGIDLGDDYEQWKEDNPITSTVTGLTGLFGAAALPYRAARAASTGQKAIGSRLFSPDTYKKLESDRLTDRLSAGLKIEAPLIGAHASAEGFSAGEGSFDPVAALQAGVLDTGIVGGVAAANLPKVIGRLFEQRPAQVRGSDTGSLIPQIELGRTNRQINTLEDLIKTANPKDQAIHQRELEAAKIRKQRQEQAIIADTGSSNFAGMGGKVRRDSDGVYNHIKKLKSGDNKELNDAFHKNYGSKAASSSKWINLEDAISGKDPEAQADLMMSLDVLDVRDALPHLFQARLVRNKNDITKKVAKNMQEVGRDPPMYPGDDGSPLFIAQEEDGLYVIAKHLPKRGSENNWFVAKTDKPSMFINQQYLKDFTDLTEQQTIDAVSLVNDVTTPMLNGAMRYIGSDYRNFATNPVTGLGEAVERHVTPKLHQLRNSPAGRMALNVITDVFQNANLSTNQLIRGVQEFGDKSVASSVIKQKFNDAPDSLSGLARKLNDDEWFQVSKFIMEHNAAKIKPGKASVRGTIEASSGLTDNAKAVLLRHIDIVDGRITEGINTAEKTGTDQTIFGVANQSGMFRIAGAKRDGFRTYAVKRDGTVEGAYTGKSKREAEDYARGIHPQLKLITLRRNEALSDINIAQMNKLRQFDDANPAATLGHFDDVRGGGVLDYDEYMAQVHDMVGNFNNHIASNVAKFTIGPAIHKLNVEGDHNAIAIVQDRLRQAEGETISAIGKLVDSGAAKAFGTTKGRVAEWIGNYNALESGFRLAFDPAHMFMNITGFAIMGSTLTSLLRHGAVETLSKSMPSLLTKIDGRYAPVKDTNYLRSMFRSWGEMMNPDAELMELYREGLSTGRLRQIPVERPGGEAFFDNRLESLQATLRDPKKNMIEKGWESLKYGANISLAAPEQVARMMAYSFARNLARDTVGITDLADRRKFVNEFVDLAMHRYGAPDRAALFSGATGSNAGLFKTWALGTIYQMQLGAQGISEIAKRDGFAKASVPLLKFLGYNVPLAGGLGVPLVGAPLGVYELFDEDANVALEEFVYDEISDGRLGDGLLYGLPAALGWSTHSRAQLPGSELVRDAQMLTNVLTIDRIEQLSNAYQAIKDHETSGDPNPVLVNPQVTNQVLRGISPKIIHRLVQVANEDDFVHARSGYPIERNITLADKLGYVMGFSPTDIDHNYQLASVLWKDNQARRNNISKLGKAMFDAGGDSDRIDAILRQAQIDGVDVESVIRSYETRLKEAKKDVVERAETEGQREKFKILFDRYRR